MEGGKGGKSRLDQKRGKGEGERGVSNGSSIFTYGERLGVDAVLDHGDADGQGPAVEMAVL